MTIAGTIDGAADNEGSLQVTGTLKTFSGAIGSTYRVGTLDIDADVDFDSSVSANTVTLDGAILGATSLSFASTVTINDDITTTGTQTYAGAVIIGTDGVTLTTTNSQITFSSTVNSEASEANALNISVGSSEVEFDGVIGGGTNGSLGAITITGALDLDAALTSATSLSVRPPLTSVPMSPHLAHKHIRVR